MFITRQNLRGGAKLRGFPLAEDKDSGFLGYKIGYCSGCNKDLLMRTIEIGQVVEKFYHTLEGKKRRSLRERIIQFLGGVY